MTLNLEDSFDSSLQAKTAFRRELSNIRSVSERLVKCFQAGNKLLICGNGGSAADAQHIAAELVGRYKTERRGLPAIALTTDTSILTAWSNDYQYETVFSRQVEALGKPGDLFFGISTSGNSKNVVLAAKKAREMNLEVIGFSGENPGALSEYAHQMICVPSKETARIQECHLLAYHLICEFVDHEITR